MKFIQIKPQKARGKFTESMWADPAWSAEIKYDGDRRIAQFCPGMVRFTGTRESVDGTGYVEKSLNLPHLNRVPVPPAALVGTVLDGEIVAPWAADLPGGESKWVTSIMGSSPERAIQLQKERGWLEYMVFDCLWFKGKDLRTYADLNNRRRYLAEVLALWKNPYAKLVPCVVPEKAKHAEWGRAREGLVFKHESHTYGDESLWVKLKKEWTADVVIMGFEPGKGKYQGNCGAIVFGQYSKELDKKATHPFLKGPWIHRMGTCSGFTDAQRRDFWLHPKKYIDHVMEIMHNGREPTGAFRHPRFKRFRPDKSPKDCVYREDEI